MALATLCSDARQCPDQGWFRRERTSDGVNGAQSQSRPGRWQGAPGTYVLDVVEAKRGTPAGILQGLSGEGLIMTVDKAVE
jgi:hypothetical protein